MLTRKRRAELESRMSTLRDQLFELREEVKVVEQERFTINSKMGNLLQREYYLVKEYNEKVREYNGD